MCLVKNDGCVIRNHLTKLRPSHRGIGKEKMMVDDHDVRVLGASTHLCDKARLVVGTFLANTYIAAGVDTAPEAQILRQKRKLGTVADLCVADPVDDRAKVVDVVHSVEDRLVAGLVNAVETGVV